MNTVKRFLAYNKSVSVMIVDSTQMVQEARELHHLSNLATAALGRTLSVGAMISSTFEKDNRMTIQIKGNGPLGNIVVCANGNSTLKGYVDNPEVELPLNSQSKIDVGKGVGSGTLTVIKDLGLKEPYIGTCELLSGEIGDDFAYYFNVSEQTPSVVSVGVLIGINGDVEKAGGYIISPLPDCDTKIIDKLEEINIKAPHMTALLNEYSSLDEIARFVTGDKDIEEVYNSDVLLKCDCSAKKIEATIVALGKKDAIEIAKEQGKLELTCNFCNKKYSYTEEEVEKLFEGKKK